MRGRPKIAKYILEIPRRRQRKRRENRGHQSPPEITRNDRSESDTYAEENTRASDELLGEDFSLRFQSSPSSLETKIPSSKIYIQVTKSEQSSIGSQTQDLDLGQARQTKSDIRNQVSRKAQKLQLAPISHSLGTSSSINLNSKRLRVIKKGVGSSSIRKAILRETRSGTRRGNSLIIRELKQTARRLQKVHLLQNSLNESIITEEAESVPAFPRGESLIILASEDLIAQKFRNLEEEESSNKEKVAPDLETGMAIDNMAIEPQSQTFPLLDDCYHYTHRNEVEWDIVKYFDQRYSIFSKYDEGIVMTDDAWFGVTPEPVANKVAEDLAKTVSPSKTVLIDMFAGAGGNVIAFALSNRWSKVIAIEKSPSVIACAQNNAAIYGVLDRITWINDDSFAYLKSNEALINPSETVIFASPPWGGPGYSTDEIFNLSTMIPYSLQQIHDACQGMESALYLPRSSDLRQIAKLATEGKKIEVVQYCMQGAGKALVAYIPASKS